MRKLYILAVLLLAGLFLAGCGTAPDDFRPAGHELDTDIDIVTFDQLATVDFVLVPNETYYVLLEEGLKEDNKIFFRRYARYDGKRMIVSETTRDISLIRSFPGSKEAKAWLAQADPSQLQLPGITYIHETVWVRWEQEEYDYSLEAQYLTTIDGFKRLGALSRISDDLVFHRKPDELEEMIKAMETEYLPTDPHLSVSRESEALPLSFTYSVTLTVHARPLPETSPEVARARLRLTFKVDELGHPINLLLETHIQAIDKNIGIRMKDTMNQVAAFSWVVRESLVEELRLYGVNEHNPLLNYANASLHYESEQKGLQFTERYTIQ
jgi:hypothetical protein